ncbi:MAG: hypothetical protein KKF77_04010 [Proteobacteria bacterium]|nr:hypothetical protein [Pseudomonadota bacterium]
MQTERKSFTPEQTARIVYLLDRYMKHGLVDLDKLRGMGATDEDVELLREWSDMFTRQLAEGFRRVGRALEEAALGFPRITKDPGLPTLGFKRMSTTVS